MDVEQVESVNAQLSSGGELTMTSPRIIGLAATIGAIIAMLWASPVSAHATVVATNPADGAIVDTAPVDITVEFSEPVTVVPAETLIVAPDGSTAHKGEPSVSGSMLTYHFAESGEGTYLVSFRVISDDGHPIPGGFTFSLGSASAAPRLDTPTDTDGLVTAALTVNRALGYVGLALLLGSGLFLTVNGRHRRATARITVTGAVLVAMTAIGGLYLQVPYQAGSGMFDITGDDVGSVLAGPIGGASLTRLLVVLAALPLLRPLVLGTAGRANRWALAVLGAVLVMTWPATGHALTSPVPPWSLLADTVHLGAAAVWLGGLATLAVALLRRDRLADAARALPMWSIWATWLVAALAIAGLGHAVIQIGAPWTWFESSYGVLVIVKVGLFALLIATAAAARRIVGRISKKSIRDDNGEASGTTGSRDDDTSQLVSRTRRLIVTELVIGALVLAVTAVLVRTIPSDTGVSSAAPTYFSTELTGETYKLQFELDPGSIGENALHLYIFTPEGEPFGPIEWQVSMSNPDAGIAPVRIGVALLAPNHVSTDVVLPSAGEWLFVFKIRTDEFDRETVSTTVTVE